LVGVSWGLPGGFEGYTPRNPQATPSQPPANPQATPSEQRTDEDLIPKIN